MNWSVTTYAVFQPRSLKAYSAAVAPMVVFHIESVNCLSPSDHEL